MERVLKHPCFKPNGWTPSVVIYWFRANLVFPPRFVSRSDIACSDTRDLSSVKGYKRACLIVCRLPFGQRFLPSQCGLRNIIHEQYPYHGRFRAWCFSQKGYPKRVRAVLPVKLESMVAVYAGEGQEVPFRPTVGGSNAARGFCPFPRPFLSQLDA